MKFTHDFNKVLFYIFMLVITVSYILIFLNTLYMKLFLWKSSELNNKKVKLPDGTEMTQIEPNGAIIPMQEVYDYKLYLNSYESGYRSWNEDNCLKINYNNDIVLTTNYNLYLNGLIFKTFFTYIVLYIIIVFILYFMKKTIQLPNLYYFITELLPKPENFSAENITVKLIFLLILFPFIYLYSFTNTNLHNKYKLEFKDNPENFENYLYGEIRELINNYECFSELKKFFENVNKNNIENYVEYSENSGQKKLSLKTAAKNIFINDKYNTREQDICTDYIIFCYKLSKINEYTNVDVVKNMRDFLYLCEKAYKENNKTGYEIKSISDIELDFGEDNKSSIKTIFDNIKENDNDDINNVDIIIGTNNSDLFDFLEENKDNLDVAKYDYLIDKVKTSCTNKLNSDVKIKDSSNSPISYEKNYKTMFIKLSNSTFKYLQLANEDDTTKKDDGFYVKTTIPTSESGKILENPDDVTTEIYNLYSDSSKKILIFNTAKFFKDDKFKDFIITEVDKSIDLPTIINSTLEECYILSYNKKEYDNNNNNTTIDTVRCIFYKDASFAFEKNLGFIGKIFKGELIESGDLTTTKNNEYHNNNIFFISMLTKNLFNKNYKGNENEDGKYYFKLQEYVRTYYYGELNTNYNYFSGYIIANGIIFGIFTIILAYIVLNIYYKKNNIKDLTYDINKFLLNTKINKGHDYIINLYASIALSLMQGASSNYMPSLYLFVAILMFIILLFALPNPSNFIALFMIYILPYLVIIYSISTPVIISVVMFIIFIIILIYLIDFLNYAKDSNDATITEIIIKIAVFMTFIVIIAFLIYIYFNTDLISIYNDNQEGYLSNIFKFAKLFFIVVFPIVYIGLSIYFSLNYN